MQSKNGRAGMETVIFGKNENANDPAVMMEKWEEHLEKRRAAGACHRAVTDGYGAEPERNY